MVLIVILLLTFILSTNSDAANLLDNDLQQIKPRQIVIFVSKSLMPEVKPFAQEYPLILATLENGEQEAILNSPIIKNSLHLSLIISYSITIDEVTVLIDLLVRTLSKQATRPKCLIILSSEDGPITPALEYAWTHKFLDFTIALPNSTSYSYDPFNAQFNENSEEIFPDKLKRVNEFPVRMANVPLFNHNTALVRGRGSRLAVEGPNDLIIKAILSFMGFKVKLERISIRHAKNFTVIFSKNVSVLGFQVSQELVDDWTKINTESREQTIVALVPIIYPENDNIPVRIILNITIMSCIVRGLISLVLYFNMVPELLEVFDGMKILLNQPSSLKFQTLTSRIFVLTVTLVSVIVMNSFYVDSIKNNFKVNDIKFQSYEGLAKSKLQVISTILLFDSILNDSYNEHLRSLGARTNYLGSCDDCVSRLVGKKDAMCIMKGIYAEQFRSVYRNLDGSPAVKIAKPPLGLTDYFYLLEHGSPYVEHFTRVMRRVNEGGFSHMLLLLDGVKQSGIADFRASVEVANLQALFSILLIGYGFACFVLLIEQVF